MVKILGNLVVISIGLVTSCTASERRGPKYSEACRLGDDLNASMNNVLLHARPSASKLKEHMEHDFQYYRFANLVLATDQKKCSGIFEEYGTTISTIIADTDTFATQVGELRSRHNEVCGTGDVDLGSHQSQHHLASLSAQAIATSEKLVRSHKKTIALAREMLKVCDVRSVSEMLSAQADAYAHELEEAVPEPKAAHQKDEL